MLKPALLALLLTTAAAPALAQVPASQAQTPLPVPSSLPHALPPIPAPQDRDYPGVIRLQADLTDLDHKVVRVRQTIPVSAGHLVLQYPKFLPGNHAGTGPIQLVSGVTVTGGGRRIEWVRDTVDAWAFHLDIPQGVTEIEVSFEWLTQPDNAVWRVTMTPEIVNLQWEKALLYPAGYNHSRITFSPSVVLPAGWRQASALDVDSMSAEGSRIAFKPISLEMLADSPMFAGAHYRRIDLDPGGRSPVHLNLVADHEADLAATDEQIGKFRNLIDQTDRLYGARHYDHYEFLLALTDKLGGIGLEHHRSSENTAPSSFFTDGMKSFGTLALLPHEFTHSWNGKFRRPADEYVPNFNVPTQNTLMWVYEGQTEYWGEVLTARSGLATREEQLATIAEVAAFYDNQPGRQWRSLQDTTNSNLLGYRAPNPWPSWMRGTGDYYRESLLIWLDADTLIRERTNGRKSLDDFAKAFFGIEDGRWEAHPYTFDDVVAALNGVYAYDWATFLRSRLDAVGPDARAPLDGIARGGYRLVYTDALTPAEKRAQGGWGNDFQYSLGFTLGRNNAVGGVRWGGLMYGKDVGAGWELIAVNDRVASAETLRAAVTAAKGATTPLVLVVRRGDEVRTLSFDYHDGLRYPRLERVAGAPDRLGDILTARRR